MQSDCWIDITMNGARAWTRSINRTSRTKDQALQTTGCLSDVCSPLFCARVGLCCLDTTVRPQMTEILCQMRDLDVVFCFYQGLTLAVQGSCLLYGLT